MTNNKSSGFIWRWRNHRLVEANRQRRRAEVQTEPVAIVESPPAPSRDDVETKSEPAPALFAVRSESWRDQVRVDTSRELRRAFARTEPGPDFPVGEPPPHPHVVRRQRRLDSQ